MSPDEQRITALRTANERRKEVSELRRQIKGSRTRAAEILRDPPEAARSLAIVEVLVLARSAKGWRSSCLNQIGALAVRDRINLLVPLGIASHRTREWAATEGLRWARENYSHAENQRERVAA